MKIGDYAFYAGVEKKTYNEVKPEIVDSNRKSLLVFTSIGTIGMLLMFISSFFTPSLGQYRIMYTACFILSALLFVVSKSKLGKISKCVYVAMYLFMAMLFAFGIILGTFIEPNELSVSYVVLVFAAPLLFVDVPWRMVSAMIISTIAYIVCAIITQNPTMIEYNLTNVIPFGIASMAITSYLMVIKIKRFELERNNKLLSERDLLTGLLNRRSFEKAIHEIENNHTIENVTLCVFDVNELKATNDSLGHLAGDELLVATARCLEKTLEPYGKCFRVGGDEFMALLSTTELTEGEIKEMVNLEAARWKGKYVGHLTLSGGVMVVKKAELFENVARKVDELMYADKATYYTTIGRERRKS